MKEYIERKAVLNLREEFWKDRCDYMAVRVTNIMNIPAADVAPVVHGEWIQIKEPLGWKDIDCVMCSACEDKWIMDKEYDLDFYKEQWKYCPFCGAKMDGGNK